MFDELKKHHIGIIVSDEQRKKIENFIDQNELGLQITKLEKSGAEECGWVKFYFIKNHGIIELNLLKKDV